MTDYTLMTFCSVLLPVALIGWLLLIKAIGEISNWKKETLNRNLTEYKMVEGELRLVWKTDQKLTPDEPQGGNSG